jgi:hypothetical protein
MRINNTCKPIVLRVTKNPHVQRVSGWASAYAHTVARLLVCMYFVNFGGDEFQLLVVVQSAWYSVDRVAHVAMRNCGCL